ncbi:transcriptional regulator [Gilliamella apicola]|uniref:HTH-type transcriptional repressor AllR n=1 Tax=Gilliamella apicola TaxID=1196095 RepID=A0A556SBD3_9GAMM|nr:MULTISPECIES: IclR family transcriptional regulator [Gilliamella]MBI0031174.1 IclR family transcriptional regulator [Gilliamella sp. B14384G15]MBI0058523.1 IclR family transcriptional regulator [Gilliamella sp. B14384G12]MBI0095415.1 IclR family transcriptional regulator [Gilliamella sp. W8136]MCT6867229.1 IclR family transcriptional regulator [Gilliamella apicola]OTQ00320.1 transcriptional regulator [Gilliamella apicola]
MSFQKQQSTLDNALTLLEIISHYSSGISLAEIVKLSRMAKTTVFRILDILKKRQYLCYDASTEKYFLDVKAFELGVKGLMNISLVGISIPFLKKLAAKLNETCFLAVYHDGSVIYLYKAEGELAVKTNSHIGSRMPVYCTGLGKSLLAYQPLVEINKVLSRPLVQFTSKTIVDREAIHNSLAKVCIDGYSMDDEEVEEGLTCIAVPIFIKQNKVVGAISVAGSSFRIIQKKELIISELKSISSSISVELKKKN